MDRPSQPANETAGKRCTRCKVPQPLSMFRKDRRCADGHGSICTPCNRLSVKKYRERNLDACRNRTAQWRRDNPRGYMLWRAQQHARIRGYACTITEADIPMPKICPLLGVELNYDARRNDPATASLDRIDSTKGYVPGNVQTISWRANQIKSNATPYELRLIAAKMNSNTLAAVLPTDTEERNKLLLADGLLDYFPLALAEVAKVSYVGNNQHNPGQPMHWARTKSTDHANKIVKHLIDRGTVDVDGLRHSAKVAWRALALLQEELETAGGVPGRASRF